MSKFQQGDIVQQSHFGLPRNGLRRVESTPWVNDTARHYGLRGDNTYSMGHEGDLTLAYGCIREFPISF